MKNRFLANLNYWKRFILSMYIVILLLFTPFLAQNYNFNGSQFNIFDGTTGSSLTANEIANLINCNDPVLSIINCYPYNVIGDTLTDVTILVMDTALDPAEWEYLENNDENVEVDIVRYTYMAINTELGNASQISVSSSSDLQQTYEKYPDQEVNALHHGSNVISSIVQIARNVKIVYMAISLFDDEYGYLLRPGSEFFGLSLAYDWIIDNKDDYGGIDIITLSSSYNQISETIFSESQSNTLKNHGIFLLTSSGTGSHNFNDANEKAYPAKFASWFTVGAIQEDGTISSSSPWGSNTPDSPDAVDFVMSGVGVPTYDIKYGWKYNIGTSFSTPYLAAVVAIIIEEFRQNEGNGNNPSIDKIIEILKLHSSRNSFDQTLGWGYINIYVLYFDLNSVESPPPNGGGSGGGGGCGPNPCLEFGP